MAGTTYPADDPAPAAETTAITVRIIRAMIVAMIH